MEAGAILGVIRTQKHDFLNHLQVILGYLQLNKISEARKYIEEVAFETGRLSKINHLYPAEAALVLLVAQNEAARQGITMEYDIQTDLRTSALPGDEISACLEDALAQVIVSLGPPLVSDRRIKVSLTEEQGYYVCEIDFYPGNPGDLEERIKVINDRLNPREGRAEFKISTGRGVISLYFPVR